MVSDRDCRDAGIVASAQRVEHYEIAVYGTLATWAKQLGFGEDERVLHDILQEERRADEKLSQLAERDLNREAAEHIQSTTYARHTLVLRLITSERVVAPSVIRWRTTHSSQ